MLDLTPDPIAFTIGPLPVFWYGICYALGLLAAYLVVAREATWRGQDSSLVINGMFVVAIAALIGGRLYHVIDQWPLYADDPLKIVLPPYTGLGVYGGIITGTIAGLAYGAYHKVPLWVAIDVVAPGLFVMQAIGRWGNFFNQELYGPPTDLPWGIPIDCAHRIAAYPCSEFPLEVTRFQPLFLYESISGLLGAAVLLWLSHRRPALLRRGDLIAIFFMWYGVVRFALEFLRTDNWTIGGIATAQIFSILSILVGLGILLTRRRRRPFTDGMPAYAATGDDGGGDGREDDRQAETVGGSSDEREGPEAETQGGNARERGDDPEGGAPDVEGKPGE
jgi:phosphatidylglycerol:prolipoprotein diacylglycerol transferase